jgi:predicted XRE-type DNA-binding protein
MKRTTGYEVGGGSVFADISLPNAGEHLIKAQLVHKIDALMKERKLKQTEAAALFGVKEPDVSKMLRGDFRQFSVDRHELGSNILRAPGKLAGGSRCKFCTLKI